MGFEDLKQPYFGKEYELDLVGEIKIKNPRAFFDEIKRLQEKAKEKGWQPRMEGSLPFWSAVDVTKKSQPGDPTNPDREFAKELRLAIGEKFGWETDEDLDQIKFYTAVGGPLDAHGVDFFISFKPENKREEIVTFDITKNPEKKSSAADLIIGGDIPDRSDPDFKEDKYLNKIEEYADQAFQILQEKTSRNENRRAV